MEKEKLNGGVVNHFEKDSQCQVFNGNVTGCVFAMPGSTVTQQAGQAAVEEVKEEAPAARQEVRDERLCMFVHPSVSSAMEWQIHDEVKRLVSRQRIQDICQYLFQMKEEKMVLLPQNAERAYQELVRMGMPNGEGFNLKTFMKYYKR